MKFFSSRPILFLSLALSSLPVLSWADETPAAAPTSVLAPVVPTAIIASGALASAATNPEEAATILTLETSIRLAIEGATSVLTAQNDTKITGAQLLQSYGQFLPNLSVTANYSYNTGKSYFAFGTPALVNGTGTTAGYTVASTLNLFNGLGDFANLKSSLLKRDASEMSLARAKQQIALDITQGYLQVVLDNKIADIAKKNLMESRAREKLLEAQTALGAKSLSELFRQQAQTSSDEAFLLKAENKTRSDQVDFLYKLRKDANAPYEFVEPALNDTNPVERFQNESELLKIALNDRPDLKASLGMAEAAKWDLTTSWSTYFPKLDLYGTAVSGGRDLQKQVVNGVSVLPATQRSLETQLHSQINYTVGLNLTWNIFDRFVTNQNIVKARATAKNQELLSQDKHNQIEGDVRKAYGSYQLAIQQLNSSKKGLEAAQKAYAVMEGRYKVGASSFIDLVTSQAMLVQAESARAQALIDFQLQIRTVQFVIGEVRAD